MVRGDRLIVGALAGATVVGVYGLAATFSELMWILPMTLSQFAFRRASLHPQTAATSKVWLPLLGATTLLAVMVTLVGRIVIDTVFGAAYAHAADLLPVLALAALPMASFYFDSAALNGLGAFRRVATITYAGAAALFAGCAVLIPLYGAMGAAIASCISYSIMGGWARVALIGTGKRANSSSIGQRNTDLNGRTS